MVFQSFGFLAFLPVAAGVCLSVARRSRPRPPAVRCLTAAGLVFYAAGGGWGALLVLAAGLAVSAAAVRALTAEDARALPGGDGPRTRGDARSAARRRLCLVLAAAWHIGVLTAFKYTGFLTGGRISPGWAPLGLSFFSCGS